MSQHEAPLADAVDAFLADSRIAPFTTPGHKRSPELADELLRLDLPLSGGADDLHLRADVLGRAERLAADLWGADLCRFCVNGSTEGNQALMLALGMARPGAQVVVSRNLHRSVFAGLVLAGLDPIWVRPEIDAETGLALAIPPAAIEAALGGAASACAVALVEPNFVGVMSDVEAIAASAHGAGVPLVVDQAWGAHLGFHPSLPPHTLALGADAMVTSAHKTLAAFTQSAYLFARGGRLDLGRLGECLETVHTTSPSAAILSTLDRMRRLLAERGPELLERTIALVARARETLAGVQGLRLPSTSDPTKLVLALASTGAEGLAVEQDLSAAGIRLELASRDTLIPLITIGDTGASVARLVDALRDSIERRRGEPRASGGASVVWGVEPEVAMSPRTAFFAPRETVGAGTAVGRIAAEAIVPYPPGIPALAPGEVITRHLLDALREAARDGTRIASCADATLATVQVVSHR